jgi:hypothetical protein
MNGAELEESKETNKKNLRPKANAGIRNLQQIGQIYQYAIFGQVSGKL